MNELPMGWVETELGELGKWSSGGTPSRKHAEYYQGSIPWVKTGDLNNEFIQKNDVEEFITKEGLEFSSAKIFPAGTLLLAMYGATIGKVGILKIDAATNQACAALISEGITKDLIPFVKYFLSYSLEKLKLIGQGGAQPNISQAIIKSVPIPLPPLNEQRRIVEKLDLLFIRSRRIREELGRVAGLCDRYKQAILAAAFRGDLTADWREENSQNSANRCSFTLYDPPKAIDLRECFNLPNSWVWDFVGNLSNVVRGSSPRPAGNPKYFGGDIPWITVGYLTADNNPYLTIDKISTFVTEEGKKKSRFIKAGTLMLTNSGATLGVPKIIEFGGCFNDGSVALLNIENPLKLYLYYFLRFLTSRYRAIHQGAAQPNLNINIVKSTPVSIPPLAEQKEIVSRIEKLFKSIEIIQQETQKALDLCDRLEQATLAKAFRGELVPQDPNDEPAAALLERIRTQKQTQPKSKTVKSKQRSKKQP